MSIDSTSTPFNEKFKNIKTASEHSYTTRTGSQKSVTFAHNEAEVKPLPICPPEEDDSSEWEESIVAPDGGWGWFVVLASFISNLIVDGCLYSFGVLLDPIQKATNKNVHLQSSISSIAWVSSLAGGFHLSVGPLASALSSRYGFRLVTIAGSIVTLIGFLGTAIVCESFGKPLPSALYVLYGLIGGIGLGLIYCPAILVVGIYFDKRRALATGIAVCGSGIGTFIFPPIINEIIECCGWEKALYFQAAGAVICGVFGLLYKPILPTMVKRDYDFNTKLQKALRNSFASPSGSIPALMVLSTLKKRRELRLNSVKTIGSEESIDDQKIGTSKKNKSETMEVKYKGDLKPGSFTSYIPSSAGSSLEDVQHPQPHFSDVSVDEIYIRNSGAFFSNDSVNNKQTIGDKLASSSAVHIIESGSVKDQLNTNPIPIPYDTPKSEKPILIPTPELELDSIEKKKESFCSIVIRILKSMVDISLLVSPTFILLTVSGFFDMLGIGVPYMYLKAMAMETIGTSKSDATYLISAIGAANMAGRIGCGLIADFPNINVVVLKNTALTITGISIVIIPFLKSYYQYVIASCVFGFTLGSSAALRSALLVELLGVEKLINAFGLKLLFQGIASMLGTPLAGFEKEVTGSYSIPFYVAGGFIIFAAVLGYPLTYIKRWENKGSSLLLEEAKYTDCTMNTTISNKTTIPTSAKQ